MYVDKVGELWTRSGLNRVLICVLLSFTLERQSPVVTNLIPRARNMFVVPTPLDFVAAWRRGSGSLFGIPT